MATINPDVEAMLARLDLTSEEADDVSIGADVLGKARDQHVILLVGKLLIQRTINVEALRGTVLPLWRGRQCEIRDLGGNKFSFEFADSVDKAWVQRMEPWTFDNNLLVLKDVDMKVPISELVFDEMPIWVQIHGLPLGTMTRDTGEKVGAKAGRVVKVDSNIDGVGWGEFLKVRVVVNLNKALSRGSTITVDGTRRWVSFRYERLPNFCFHCGRVGHAAKDCGSNVEEVLKHQPQESRYGVWLRAARPGRSGSGRERERWYDPERTHSGRWRRDEHEGSATRDNLLTRDKIPQGRSEVGCEGSVSSKAAGIWAEGRDGTEGFGEGGVGVGLGLECSKEVVVAKDSSNHSGSLVLKEGNAEGKRLITQPSLDEVSGKEKKSWKRMDQGVRGGGRRDGMVIKSSKAGQKRKGSDGVMDMEVDGAKKNKTNENSSGSLEAATAEQRRLSQ